MAHGTRATRRMGEVEGGCGAGVVAGSVVFALALAACSGSAPTGFGTGGTGSSTGTGGTGTGSLGATDGGPTGSLAGSDGGATTPSSGDCPASAKLVYVTGPGSQLYSFLPPSTFKLVGTLGCLGSALSPTHMTVDRTGSAWVVASDGVSPAQLFKASTTDATCAAVPTWTAHAANFSDFALTFLGTTSATDNTLYMLGTSQGGLGSPVLGSFDVPTGAVTVLGSPGVPSAQGDMTTNGDGHLYFLMDDVSLALYELNPSNGAVMKTLTPNASGGGDQALAFYGGYFYAFEDNTIYQFDPNSQATTPLGQAPIQVTGAGESTCVPLVPPTSK